MTFDELPTRIRGRIDTSGDCWVWTGPLVGGYGVIGHGGRYWKVHRLVFWLLHGYLPAEVAHRCDNPPCARPEHLFAATHVENMQDMAQKGRSNKGRRGLRTGQRGEQHRAAKLTWATVAVIRASSESNVALAAKYGVSQPIISRVRSHRIWR